MKVWTLGVGKIVGILVVGVGFVWASAAFCGNTTYQYDTLGRVIKVIYPDAKQVCYIYDSAGNRTQVKRQATGTCTVATASVTAIQSAMMSAGDSGAITDSESAIGEEVPPTADDAASGN